MNKQELLQQYAEFCAAYSQQPTDVVVSAGAAIMLLGGRSEIDDIDVDISAELWDHLAQFDYERKPIGHGRETIEVGKVSCHRVECKVDTQMLEGVCCYSTGQLLIQKHALMMILDREKDHSDVMFLTILLSK